MKNPLSAALFRYLTQVGECTTTGSPSDYVSKGGACVASVDLLALRGWLTEVRQKAHTVVDSPRLRRRLEVLTLFVQGSSDQELSVAVRECAFALFYFLKGQDLIPDSLPEIGLLDDALLVETALRRNELAVRTHWESHGGTWPENI